MSRNLMRIALLCSVMLLAIILSLFATSAQINQDEITGRSTAQATDPAANVALERLRGAISGQVKAHVGRQTGYYNFVSAQSGAVLSRDNKADGPEARALAFVSSHGALFGLTEPEREFLGNQSAAYKAGLSRSNMSAAGSELRVARVDPDEVGFTHVRFDQFYQGLPVFGAQMIVHMNDSGIIAVNGTFVPNITVSTTPRISESKARQIAIAVVTKSLKANLKVSKTELAIYRIGLLEGYKGDSVLAHAVEVAGAQAREQVWINAHTGNVIIRIPLLNDVLHRIVYSPSFDPANPNNNKVKEDGDLTPTLPPPADPINNLFHYTGQTYNIFRSAFGRDSYDGIGTAPQRTVLLANEQCPNAYWDGQATNYCPDFDKDDIVSHEWGHAYTQYTHNLIYAYQSGALNESYSDIFGETLDLHNGADGIGGANNTEPTTYTLVNGQYAPAGGGVRWRMGEDVLGLSQPAALGILRDMWFPPAFGDPDKVSAVSYHCSSDDGGGVHTNSGVPNHAFAMLVDGKTFNGVTVEAIGFTRALHIYYRAMTVYQTRTTNFAEHEQALQASCRDLIGVPLNNFSTSSATGTNSGQTISTATCQQVDNAMAAVEMSKDVFVQCNFQKILDPNTPADCNGANTIFTEDWETGMDGWAVGNQGVTADWPGTNWTLKSSDLPPNVDGTAHNGTAAFAVNPPVGEPNGGTCQPGGDVSGHFWIDTPEITIPAGASDLRLKFDHFVQTELEFDGGNLKISVNGGAFTLVPQNAYVFNAPNAPLASTADGNTNPLAGEQAWQGTNEGELVGSWGTTIVDLSSLTNPGDTFKIRFDFGQDGCNGNLGWFVDTVRVFNCPVFGAPVLSAGADYENPDTNGSFTLNWTRPAGATGPDTLQESTSCGPVFSDDASELLVAGDNSKWDGTPQWTTQANPTDASTAYHVPDGLQQDDALVMKNAVTIPAGASAALTFTTRQGLEDGFDFGHVEVSANGGSFVEVANYTGPAGLTPADVFSGARSVNLSQFAGQSIKVRFRITSDPFSVGQPAGWYIDNIAITASAFSTIATTSGTSQTLARPVGTYCYRVRTSFTVNAQVVDSEYSNVQNITVASSSATPTPTPTPTPSPSPSPTPSPSPSPTPTPSLIQFSSAVTPSVEDCGQVIVQVVRTGATNARATVDVDSSDGSARQKGDYTFIAGTLVFEVGETQKDLPVLISEDAYVEGPESFTLVLSSPTGAALGVTSTTTIQIADDSPESGTNPIDVARTFVCQHYHDFLNREADDEGENFWTEQIESCGTNAGCIDQKRVNVSAAFFLSIEFQQTGYFVIRAHKAAFGAAKSNPRYAVLLKDQRAIGDGVVVHAPGWEAKLATNMQRYLEDFVSRAEFTSQFPAGMSPDAFVGKLFTNAGANPTEAERAAAIDAYGGGDRTGRVEALKSVVQSGSVFNALYNPAFVLMQYYGYLRRNPDDSPDNNFSGYDFWLNKLNSFTQPGEDARDEAVAFRRVQRAEMVRSFLISDEYRRRFHGSPSGNQQLKQEPTSVATSSPQHLRGLLREVAWQFLRVATTNG